MHVRVCLVCVCVCVTMSFSIFFNPNMLTIPWNSLFQPVFKETSTTVENHASGACSGHLMHVCGISSTILVHHTISHLENSALGSDTIQCRPVSCHAFQRYSLDYEILTAILCLDHLPWASEGREHPSDAEFIWSKVDSALGLVYWQTRRNWFWFW